MGFELEAVKPTLPSLPGPGLGAIGIRTKKPVPSPGPTLGPCSRRPVRAFPDAGEPDPVADAAILVDPPDLGRGLRTEPATVVLYRPSSSTMTRSGPALPRARPDQPAGARGVGGAARLPGSLRLAPSGQVIGIDLDTALKIGAARGSDLAVLSELLPAAEAGFFRGVVRPRGSIPLKLEQRHQRPVPIPLRSLRCGGPSFQI